MNRSDSIRRGLIYLSGEQRPDGGFIGHATADEHDFSHYREHPTPFFTALILCGLSGVAGASRIRRRAGQFLLEQRGERWSWNYWLRESDEAYNRPYPDDLDDTACALASLSLSAPGKVDGQALGYLARHLIANEAAPGGPYETWLIDRTAHPDWHDIDLAVNANISFCLDTQQVRVPELEAYLTQALRAGKLRSAYYIGEAPLLYFMARGYHGPALDALRRRLTTAVQTSHHSSALELALLLAAGAKVGLPKINLEPLCKRLLRQQQADGSWPAAALYYEPPIDGQVYYAGSAALTTGLALQAITSFGQLKTAKSAALYSTSRVIRQSS